jgi:hypothetical protein
VATVAKVELVVMVVGAELDIQVTPVILGPQVQ